MIYFAKVKEHAQIPNKRDEDAGYDIYACFDEEYILISPHETKFIPTGIASSFSNDYVALVKERGSTGSKGIGQRAGVIDSGYRGEWFIALTNHNIMPLIISKSPKNEHLPGAIIYPYDKAIAQCLFIEVPKLKINEISYEELLQIKSERGFGGIGSTGK